MKDLQLDYFYGNEAEQFCFYRIPKVLFTHQRFSTLSVEAKVLYGLLLDRMSLSVKNGWVDKNNHVYIYFTLEDAIELINVGKDKGVKLFAELDSEKGCGLIKRKKQGLGKPTIIYVMNFTLADFSKENINSDQSKSTDEGKNNIEYNYTEEKDCEVSEKHKFEFLDRTEMQTSENPKSVLLPKSNSRLLKKRRLHFCKTEANNTNINNTKYNNTEFNDTYPILSYHDETGEKGNDEASEVFERKSYRKLICSNIDYEYLQRQYDDETVCGVVELMLDLICSKKEYLVIGCEKMPHSIVKSRFLKLGCSHVEYVLDCLKQNKTKIRNIKSYLLTSLYNSYSTIGHYYTAEVNHDFYEHKGGEKNVRG